MSAFNSSGFAPSSPSYRDQVSGARTTGMRLCSAPAILVGERVIIVQLLMCSLFGDFHSSHMDFGKLAQCPHRVAGQQIGLG